jgi:hypothetical protein
MKTRTHVLLFALLLGINACATRRPAPTPQAAPVANQPPPARSETLVLAYEGEDGKTALDLLKAKAKVRTSTNQFGELVEEINGVRSEGGSYLIYFVNGAKAKTGAGNYITKKGEKIEWRLIGPKPQP